MSTKSSKKARSSAQILAEIAALPPSVQGTIYKNVRKNGTAAVYYNSSTRTRARTTRSRSRCVLACVSPSVRLQPVRAYADADVQGHPEVERGRHLAADDLLEPVHLAEGRVED